MAGLSVTLACLWNRLTLRDPLAYYVPGPKATSLMTRLIKVSPCSPEKPAPTTRTDVSISMTFRIPTVLVGLVQTLTLIRMAVMALNEVMIGIPDALRLTERFRTQKTHVRVAGTKLKFVNSRTSRGDTVVVILDYGVESIVTKYLLKIKF